MLESAKLTFSRVGVHTMEGHVGNMYMPRIVLRIQGRKSAKIGYLMPDRFDQKDYIGLALLPDFIVVITKNEYIVVDEKAEERKAISRDEAGEIVGVQEEGFLCRKENQLQLRNIDCELIGERPLTAEDIWPGPIVRRKEISGKTGWLSSGLLLLMITGVGII